jgi:hypothetical protein
MVQKPYNMPSDMLHTPNTHNKFKTCITWTQNMFWYHKVKTKGRKGRLRETIVIIFLYWLHLQSKADLTSPKTYGCFHSRFDYFLTSYA